MTVLPKGWSMTAIDQIADINPRHPPTLEDSLSVTFVRMPSISESAWEFESTEERRLGQVRKGFTHFAEGDVLLAKITPCMENGKAAVASNLINGLGCGTTELHVLRPLGGIDPKYIYHFIHRDSFREEAARNFTGTAGQLRVPVSFVNDAQIPLAPLNEQRRIVAKLEKLLNRVDAAQKRLATVPDILKRFRQSVLAAACSGKLTADWRRENLQVEKAETLFERIRQLRNGNTARRRSKDASTDTADIADIPNTWKSIKLDSLCDSSRGISYGVIKLGPEFEGGVPCLRTSNVRPLRIEIEHVKRISPDVSANYRRTILEGSEVLVNVRGTLGGVAVVPRSMQGWNISREVAVVPLLPEVESKYIAFWIASVRSQNWLSGVEKGVAYTGINLEDLRLLPTSLPPFAEQQEIVRRVEELFKTADALEARYNKAKAYVDKLTQSILAKAFRGELVPQDPSDEPGSILLARIKSSSQKGKTASRPNPRKANG